MGGMILTLIPVAIGVAISPVPIIEPILVLFSRRRAANTTAFVVALIVLTAAALAVGATGETTAGNSGGSTSTGIAIALAVMGLLLVLVGAQNWRNRADTSEPKAFQKIAGMAPAAVAFLALGATFLNPKNLVLLLAAGQTIDAATSGSKLLIGALFVILATAPYTLAASYALLGGEAAKARLDRARAWLVASNRLIMALICTPLGALLLVKGIAAL
jgi:hypothetical protein